MLRRRRKRLVDEDLLNITFLQQEKLTYLRDIAERAIDPHDEVHQKVKLAESLYTFLIKEVKHRKISALRMN